MKKQPEKPKRGRPSFTNPDARRVVLPRTYVAPDTLAGIRADGRPAGRVIDDLWTNRNKPTPQETEAMKTPTESSMRKEAARLQEELWKIEQARAESKNKKLIGKCFKYRNHFSSPSEGWWLYANVTGVDGNWCVALDFQKKEDGTFEIRPANTFTNGDGWTEIGVEEFDAEWSAFLLEIASLNARP